MIAVDESLPNNYEVTPWNLELNSDLKHRVIPVNATISCRDGFVEFSYNTPMDGGASICGGFKVRVKSMGLPTLVKEVTSIELNLASLGLGLKMDCKDANTVLP
ncbi:MAG: hypothetical protein LM582_09605 [Desulfurococcaceae archaeon]|nr:hypothetical protein [Desulfurococcaceae archaeon]